MKRFLISLLLAPVIGVAQARREVMPLTLWPEAQAELTLKNGDYLLLALRGERESDAGYRANARLGFNRGRVTLGYEHFWTEHWSWGATAALRGVTGSGSPTLFVPELLLRHRGPIGPLTFGQRLSLERTMPLQQNLGGPTAAETNAQLRFDLEKLFPVGKLTLRPRLSYEALTHVRLQKDENDGRERAFQFTALRAEIGCRVSRLLDFTPWFAYQTDYSFSLDRFDRPGHIETPAGPYNKVTPVLGLDVRLTIGRGDAASLLQRLQLPTQH